MTREEFRELVGTAIGEASMCWDPIPTGVFDATRASALVDRIVDSFPLNEKYDHQLLVKKNKELQAELDRALKAVSLAQDVITSNPVVQMCALKPSLRARVADFHNVCGEKDNALEELEKQS